MYTIVMWPDVQELMEKPGFDENSYLACDEKALEDFGSSAYFVSVEFLNRVRAEENEENM